MEMLLLLFMILLALRLISTDVPLMMRRPQRKLAPAPKPFPALANRRRYGRRRDLRRSA